MLDNGTDPTSYGDVLERLKARIRSSRSRAALRVNLDLITLYWGIGREILDRQEREGWGTKIVERLSVDLRHAFPEMRGLSRSNLMSMRAFACAWPDEEVVQRVVGQLPWGHNIDLLHRLDQPGDRLFYAVRAIEHGWSRRTLQARIGSGLHEREGKALTNFAERLPTPSAEAVQRMTRDPYNLAFLDIEDDAEERDVERALLADMRAFMLELGAGFAFVGSQFRLEVGGDEFFIDLLFFHTVTNRYVVIDLKIGRFTPRDAGQINFYVNVVDDRLRLAHHEPTVGIVLCAGHNERVVRYALSGLAKPVGVARWSGPRSETRVLAEAPDDVGLPAAGLLEGGFDRIVERHAAGVRAAEEAGDGSS